MENVSDERSWLEIIDGDLKPLLERNNKMMIFIAGFFVGMVAAVFVISLLVAAKEADERNGYLK